MIKNSDLFRLVILGKTIPITLVSNLPENEFIKSINKRLTHDDTPRLSSNSDKLFIGGFDIEDKNSVIIKSKKILSQQETLNSNILIHGTVKKDDDNSTSFNYHILRSDFLKKSIKTVTYIVLITFGFILYSLINTQTLYSFAIITLFLVAFYFLAVYMMITQTKRQLKYFDKHLLSYLKQ